MIEVNGLTKTFGEIKALKDVSFTVETGQIVGFLGANGAGKTTTMDIISGCAGADAGEVKICGEDIFKNPIAAKTNLGYLPDEPPLHLDMRVKEFLTYVAKIRKVASADVSKSVDKVMQQLSLGDVQKRLVGNLSKGYKQRVALGQAIVHNPAVLILDEPTEGLDPNQILQIRTLIRELAGDHTILLSSHILSEVENTCDHIVIINKGEIVKRGTYQEIVRQKDSVGSIYRMRFARNSKEFVKTLGAMQGIHTASAVEDEFIEFSFDDKEETIEQVVKKAVDSGYGLRELTPQSQSLEDVFVELTH